MALRLRISDVEEPTADDPMGEPTLQRRLWAAYMSRGYSRRQFSRAIGVHGATVVTWCTGEKDPDLRQLIAASLLLDYPLEQLIFGRAGQAGARALVEGRVPPSDELLVSMVRSYAALIGGSTVFGGVEVPPRLAGLSAERWAGGDGDAATGKLGEVPLDVTMAQSLLALRRGPDIEIPTRGPGREEAQRALRGWASTAAHGLLRASLERGVRDETELARRVGHRWIEFSTDDEADEWAACVREVVDELTGAAERRRVFAALDQAAELYAEVTTSADAAASADDDEADDELDDEPAVAAQRPSPVAVQMRPASPPTPEPVAPDSPVPGGLARAREAYASMMQTSRAGGGRSLSDDEIDALIAREVSEVSRTRGAVKAPPAAPPRDNGPTKAGSPGSRTRR